MDDACMSWLLLALAACSLRFAKTTKMRIKLSTILRLCGKIDKASGICF